MHTIPSSPPAQQRWEIQRPVSPPATPFIQRATHTIDLRFRRLNESPSADAESLHTLYACIVERVEQYDPPEESIHDTSFSELLHELACEELDKETFPLPVRLDYLAEINAHNVIHYCMSPQTKNRFKEHYLSQR
jgi:hypothetical protein